MEQQNQTTTKLNKTSKDKRVSDIEYLHTSFCCSSYHTLFLHQHAFCWSLAFVFFDLQGFLSLTKKKMQLKRWCVPVVFAISSFQSLQQFQDSLIMYYELKITADFKTCGK